MELRSILFNSPIKDIHVQDKKCFVLQDNEITCLDKQTFGFVYVVRSPKLITQLLITDNYIFAVTKFSDTILRWNTSNGEPRDPVVFSDLQVTSINIPDPKVPKILVYTNSNTIALYDYQKSFTSVRKTDNQLVSLIKHKQWSITVNTKEVLVNNIRRYIGTILSDGIYLDPVSDNLFFMTAPQKYRRMNLNNPLDINEYNISKHYRSMCPYEGYIYFGVHHLRKVSYHGTILQEYPQLFQMITAVAADDNVIYTGTLSGLLMAYNGYIQEEDIQNSSMYEFQSQIRPIPDQPTDCSNTSLITLEDYTKDDSPVRVYLPKSSGEFEKALCFTLDELKYHLQSDLTNTYPNNIMAICTRPSNSQSNTTGHGAQPTHKIVVKLPVGNLYVTLGSIFEIIKNHTKPLYALPLYSGRKRRIGNVKGVYGASMNHCQTPGFNVYKIYQKEPLQNGTNVVEDSTDFLDENVQSLLASSGGLMTDAMTIDLLQQILETFQTK
ncbi:MAG: hypothetical protein EBU90_10300 [Proteobacteria bacterium]|nr:hypothetical protein [Pseudomonadota bacterium]NBP13800.1 hypothetical protein [bacterium]